MEQDISYHSCAGIILLDTLKGTGSKIKQTGMFLPSVMYLLMVIRMSVCLDVVIFMARMYLLNRENLYMLPICCMNQSLTPKMCDTLKC